MGELRVWPRYVDSLQKSEVKMAFPIDQWKSQIREVLSRISDETYQKEAWFNCHHEVSSPDELICQLYDDFLFEEFISSNLVNLSHNQRSAARSFLNHLTEFCDKTPSSLDPYATIRDPRWIRIRREAHELIKELFLESGSAA